MTSPSVGNWHGKRSNYLLSWNLTSTYVCSPSKLLSKLRYGRWFHIGAGSTNRRDFCVCNTGRAPAVTAVPVPEGGRQISRGFQRRGWPGEQGSRRPLIRARRGDAMTWANVGAATAQQRMVGRVVRFKTLLSRLDSSAETG